MIQQYSGDKKINYESRNFKILKQSFFTDAYKILNRFYFSLVFYLWSELWNKWRMLVQLEGPFFKRTSWVSLFKILKIIIFKPNLLSCWLRIGNNIKQAIMIHILNSIADKKNILTILTKKKTLRINEP